MEAWGLIRPSEEPTVYGSGIHYCVGDVLKPDSMRPLFASSDGKEITVIHAAGIVSIARRLTQDVYDVNVTGTKNIVDLSRQYGALRFLYVSSVHAIPEQPFGEEIREVSSFLPERVTGAYAKTKAEASQVVMDAAKVGLSAVIVHPTGMLGPYDNGHNHLVQVVADYIRGKLPACVKGGYDFVDVRDVANGCLLAAERGLSGEGYILSGTYLSIKKLLSIAGKISHKKPLPVLPVFMAKMIAPLIEAAAAVHKTRPLFTQYSLNTLCSNSHFSREKAERELGYRPRPIEETVRDMTCWIMAHA